MCERTLKVGSSFWNRLRALEKLPEASRVFGMMARLITGSGMFMDVMVYLSASKHVSVPSQTGYSGKRIVHGLIAVVDLGKDSAS